MSPDDARYLVPMQGVPDEWKATREWHTGKYFPAPGMNIIMKTFNYISQGIGLWSMVRFPTAARVESE